MYAEITNLKPTYYSIKGIYIAALVALQKRLNNEPLSKTEMVYIKRIQQSIDNEIKPSKNGK